MVNSYITTDPNGMKYFFQGPTGKYSSGGRLADLPE
jgi:hypothetical protein